MVYFFVVDIGHDLHLFAFIPQHLGELSDRDVMVRVSRVVDYTDGLCIIQISDRPLRPDDASLFQHILIKMVFDLFHYLV